MAGVPGGDAEQLDGARCGALDELLELSVQRGDLVVERLDSLRSFRSASLSRWRGVAPSDDPDVAIAVAARQVGGRRKRSAERRPRGLAVSLPKCISP